MTKKQNTSSAALFSNLDCLPNLGTALGEFINYLDIAVWQLDRSYQVIACNHKAMKTYGDDIVGRKCHVITMNNSSVCSNCPVPEVYQSNKPRKVEQTHYNVEGKRIFVEQFTIPISDRGDDFSGVLVLLVDITRHKRLERKLKRRKALLEKTARVRAAELAKSESKFAVAFDASPDAININRLKDGLYVEVNQGFTEATGYTIEDVIGKTSLELNIWENPADRQKLVQALESKGFCQNLEARFRNKDGSLTTALMSARVIDFKGEPHIISITRDISQLKEMEQTIAEQKNLFETVFNTIEDGIVITDTNRNIKLANKGMRKTFGYSPDELLGESTAMLYADEDGYTEAGGQVFARDAQANALNYYKKYQHKSGKEFLGNTFAARLFDHDNNWIGNLGIMRDVTEERKNEAERDKLIAAVQQTDEAVVITDQNGKIEFVNSAFERITGFPKEEVIGENPRILKSGEHDEQFYSELWRTISSGRTFKGQIVNKRKDGSLYTEEGTISPVVSADGSITNYVGVKRDITDQLSLEQQLLQAQKMESIGRLTGGVAHDFNNLLSVIRGHSELAMSKLTKTDKLYEDLEAVIDAAERSATIIRQLLAFSRQQTIAPQQLELNDTIENMLNMLKRLIGEEIDLQWMPYSEPLQVKIDPSQLDQILANLCVNAKDAIKDHGKITIETLRVILDEEYCSSHAGFKPGEYAVLSVSDEGQGIQEKDLPRVFDPFFTTKEPGRGTGLGLSTVYGIVKQNAGFVNVYSEINQGTTIKIYLPYSQMQDTAKKVEPQKSTLSKTGGETILLVEDDEAIRNMVAKMLNDLGYKVLEADSPIKAFELAHDNQAPLHLLLTDVVMPEMNGAELVDKLRQDFPELKCLYMSGYTVNVIANKGVLKENVHFLQKPFSRSLLARKIREALQSPSR